jgi:2-oxoglutarate ferredoxin oxidoreductase subunit beta
MAGEPAGATALTRKDFVSDQEVRWCPGCGDYAILAQVQKVLADLKVPRENYVFVSGIGCSSRLPYYVNTYGFHTIHGRAPAVATGVKSYRPDLSVWVVTGDGDGLSIGGNHLMHALRRNVDLKILLFNNKIYGLTKGQYSPTSEIGKKTKSTPAGSIDYPLHPLSFAVAVGATFIARSIDSDTNHLAWTLEQAGRHKEIFQNCVIFNDDAFKDATDRSVRPDHTVLLEHGKPLVFGKDRNRGIRMNGFRFEAVELGGGVTEKDLLVHDAKNPDPSYAFLLANMELPDLPVPVGIFRSIEKPTYEDMLHAQIAKAKQAQGEGDLKKILFDAETWSVTA